MAQHPPASPADGSFSKVDTVHSLHFPKLPLNYLQVAINCPLKATSAHKASSPLPIPPTNSGWHRGQHRRLRSPSLRKPEEGAKRLAFLFLSCLARLQSVWLLLLPGLCLSSLWVAPSCPPHTVNCRSLFTCLSCSVTPPGNKTSTALRQWTNSNVLDGKTVLY